MNNKKNNIISIEKSVTPSPKVSDSAKPSFSSPQPKPNPNFVPPPAKK